MYHGVHATTDGPIYRVGLALLDLEDPRIVLRRTDEWVFGPAEPYELNGDVGRVVFPCGWVHDPETDLLRMYYGAADTVIGLATAPWPTSWRGSRGRRCRRSPSRVGASARRSASSRGFARRHAGGLLSGTSRPLG